MLNFVYYVQKFLLRTYFYILLTMHAFRAVAAAHALLILIILLIIIFSSPLEDIAAISQIDVRRYLISPDFI